MPVLTVGLSHRTSPVELRERFAFAEAAIPEALDRLRTSGLAEEAVILSTCNRVELYAACAHSDRDTLLRLRGFLLEQARHEGPIEQEIYLLAEPLSLEHLFKVASGLDSMLLGETEILGQLKKAYDLALRHRHTGGRLNKAFQRAFNVAKHLRTETNIQRGSASVASASVELAERIFTRLDEQVVLVIGAGDTGEKAARAMVSRGARELLVTNRSPERAENLARDLGGRALPFDQWHAEFPRIDIVISSTASPDYILDRQRLARLMKPRPQRPVLLIDIAVPRDIEPECNLLDNVYLYNIDDLQAIAEDYLRQRKAELARCEEIIRERVQALLSAARPGAWTEAAPPAATAD